MLRGIILLICFFVLPNLALADNNNTDSICATGAMQSPIDIISPIKGHLAPIKFDFRPAPLTLVNNSYTVQVNFKKGSTISYNNDTFQLKNFSFQTPAGHEINHKSYPMEIDFLNTNGNGQMAIIGVLVKDGPANPELARIIKHLITATSTPKTYVTSLISPNLLLPFNKSYYLYMGSETTSPCTEGVQWFVLKNPITASKKQIAALSNVIGNNARPIQSLNNRLVVESNE